MNKGNIWIYPDNLRRQILNRHKIEASEYDARKDDYYHVIRRHFEGFGFKLLPAAMFAHEYAFSFLPVVKPEFKSEALVAIAKVPDFDLWMIDSMLTGA